MDITCDSKCPDNFYGTAVAKDEVFDHYSCTPSCDESLIHNDVTMKCVEKCESSVSLGEVFISNGRCVGKCDYYEFYMENVHSVQY